MKYKTVLFDFDGVLCHDHFFGSMKNRHPEVYEFIQTKIFYKGGDITDKEMKAEVNSRDVCKYISENTGYDFETLFNSLVNDAKNMRIETRLLDLAKKLGARGAKTALVTDNMDIFSNVIKSQKLDEAFNVIINSFDYGFTKRDFGGKLFDIALEKLKETGYNRVLLIDKSIKVKPVFESKGGTVFLYETYEKFEPWAKANL